MIFSKGRSDYFIPLQLPRWPQWSLLLGFYTLCNLSHHIRFSLWEHQNQEKGCNITSRLGYKRYGGSTVGSLTLTLSCSEGIQLLCVKQSYGKTLKERKRCLPSDLGSGSSALVKPRWLQSFLLQPHVGLWARITQLSYPRIPDPEKLCEIISLCFKLLSFGVICN